MKNKVKFILPLGLTGIILITIGATLAFFNYTGIGFTENKITTGSVGFHYDEKTHKGAGITLTDALPTDSNELEKSSNNYFEFRITGSTGPNELSYVVTARKSNNSDNIDNIVDMYLSELNTINNSEKELYGGIHKYSEYTQYRKQNNYREKVVYAATIPENTKDYDRTFRLRMWIDENVDFSPVKVTKYYCDGTEISEEIYNGDTCKGEKTTQEEDTYPYENKSFKLNINVYIDTNIDNYKVVHEAGLYDTRGNMLYTWNELEAMGLTKESIEKDYEYETYATEEGAPIKVITDNNLSGKLVLPNTITRIGVDAFYNDSSISEFELPNSLTEIAAYAFSQNMALEAITIPNSVENIRYNAFNNCSSLKSVVFEENSVITTLTGYSFSYTPLEKLEIPASVTRIEDYFLGSEGNAVDVTFEKGTKIERINRYAFYSTKRLKSIVIPNSVVELDDHQFDWSTSLESVIFEPGTKIKRIGYAAFRHTKISNLEIPASVEAIDQYVFDDTVNLTEVTFEQGINLKRIENSTFYNAKGLISIVIPASVEYIGYSAFNNCSNLENFSFENNSKIEFMPKDNLSYDSKVKYNVYNDQYYIGTPDNPYFYLYSIGAPNQYNYDMGESVSIHPDTEVIGAQVVIGNTVTSVTIPNKVRVISYYSITSPNITQITLPNSIEVLYDQAFTGTKLTSITLPSSLKKIGNSVFNNTNITTLVIPENVNDIDPDAFNRMESLTSLTVNSNNRKYDSRDNCNCVIETETNKLIAGTNVSTVPNGVKAIGKHAFYSNNITNIILPQSLEDIEESAFENSQLEAITIPKNVVSIGYQAFYSCPNLTSVVIEDNSKLKSIGGSALTRSTTYNGISSISIPAGVETIGQSAFRGISELYYDGNASNTFTNSYGQVIIDENWGATVRNPYKDGDFVYTDSSKTKLVIYKGTDTNIVIPEGVKIIGKNTFNSSNITSITLPSTLESIEEYAFRYSKSLTSLTIPASLKTIGNYAFDGCSQLATISYTGTSTLTEIGEYAFRECTSLTSLTIPSSVRTIKGYAFYRCSNITSVTFEDPNNWKMGYTMATTADLSNPTTAANKLLNQYYYYTWTKTD